MPLCGFRSSSSSSSSLGASESVLSWGVSGLDAFVAAGEGLAAGSVCSERYRRASEMRSQLLEMAKPLEVLKIETGRTFRDGGYNQATGIQHKYPRFLKRNPQLEIKPLSSPRARCASVLTPYRWRTDSLCRVLGGMSGCPRGMGPCFVALCRLSNSEGQTKPTVSPAPDV